MSFSTGDAFNFALKCVEPTHNVGNTLALSYILLWDTVGGCMFWIVPLCELELSIIVGFITLGEATWMQQLFSSLYRHLHFN